MTELQEFLRMIYRRRLTLIIVPLITVVAAFFLVRNLPDVYASHTRIATGLVDKSQQMLSGALEQEPRVSQEFDNLIQMLQLKKIINQVSYKLILHDLNNSDSAFRKPSTLLNELNPAAKQHAKDVYTYKYNHMEELSLWDKDEEGLSKVLRSMHYDYGSLTQKLTVYRQGGGDYITLEFESDNPRLSAFVLNTLTQEFINNYNNIIATNRSKAVNYLDSLLREKQAVMNDKMQALKNYKIQNRVLNLNEQAKSLYGQIADFETKREMAERDVVAYTAALKNIDSKFDPSQRQYLESAMSGINQDIIVTKQQLSDANQQYVQSGFDPKYAAGVDSLKAKLTEEINLSSDKYIYSPLVAKENLVTQKLTLETSLELSKNSIESINGELVRLNQKLDKLVPNEAVIQSLEDDIDVASKEYLEILGRYNTESMQAGPAIQLRQVEKAMPGDLQPNKKILLVILSGIISFVFCVVVLFVLFYFDNSVNNPEQLANATGLPVVGYLNKVKNDHLDLNKIWGIQSADVSMQLFKDLLRDIRFEVETDLHYGKVVAVTSFSGGKGKTFVALSLAYAFARINKKVLVIDGNFHHNNISQTMKPPDTLDQFLQTGKQPETPAGGYISILGNNSGDMSLFELQDYNKIKERMMQLRTAFDIIIIETDSLEAMGKAKEWVTFADKLLCVFEAGYPVVNAEKPHIAYLKSIGSQFTGLVLNRVSDPMVLNTAIAEIKK